MRAPTPSPANGALRIRLRGGLAVWVALAGGACGGTVETTPDPSVLMDADRAFAAAVAEGGSEAWASWFAADGAMIQPGAGEIRGREAILARMAGLDQPGVSLTWEPLRAAIAESGELGWTTGSYRSVSSGADGEVTTGQGRYVTVWQRQADGSWRVVLDLGNPTDAPPGG